MKNWQDWAILFFVIVAGIVVGSLISNKLQEKQMEKMLAEINGTGKTE